MRNQFSKAFKSKVQFGNNNYFNYNTDTLQNYNFLDLKELVAKRASNQLWGNGYIFKSDDQEVQEQIDIIENSINLLELFYRSEKIHSSYGLAIFYLAIFSEGVPFIELCMPYGQSRVSRINGIEVAAQLYFRFIQDDNSKLLKVTSDLNKTIYSEYNITSNQVSTENLLTRLPKDWELTSTTEKNIYNFVPVIFSQNLPKTIFWGDSNINAIYPDEVGVRGLKELGYKVFSTVWHELEFNKTRAFLNISQTQYNQLISEINSDKLSIKNFLFSLGDKGGMDGGNPFNLLVAAPQFDKYTDLMSWVISMYFKGCGYSSDADGARNQTSMEINTVQSDDVETTRLKRNFRQKTYSRLFAKLLTMMFNNKREISPSDFIFLIKENNILDKDKELLRIRELLAMNLTTRAQAIKEYYGLNDEQAQKLSSEIAKENENDNTNLKEIYTEVNEDEGVEAEEEKDARENENESIIKEESGDKKEN